MYEAVPVDVKASAPNQDHSVLFTILYLSRHILRGVIVVSALVDLPSKVDAGPISGLAVLTICITGIAWLLWLPAPRATKHTWSALKPMVAFLFWAILSMAWYTPTQLGLQNLTVLTGFVGLVLLSSRVSHNSFQDARQIGHLLARSVWLAAAFFLLGLLARGRDANLLFSMGHRAFPLFALIPLAWYLAIWRYGARSSLGASLVIVGLILASLARTALAAALGLFVAAQLRSGLRIRWGRLIRWGMLVGGILYLLVFYYEPLRTRFFQLDTSFRVGEIAINVMGRGTMWRAAWDSFQGSPWIGKGSGSVSPVVMAAAQQAHPHNDYLRILHDYGLVGFGLWMLGISRMWWILWKAWRKANLWQLLEAPIHLAALLGLTVILLTMITDNTLAYTFVMFPLAILLGLSLGCMRFPSARRQR